MKPFLCAAASAALAALAGFALTLWCRHLARARGLKQVSIQSASGETAGEIARVAEEQGVDQIVMGTHGKGVLGSLFLGSVPQRVVHLAKVPVLLVH